MSRSDQSVCGFEPLWGKLALLQRKTGHLSAAKCLGSLVAKYPEKNTSFLKVLTFL